MAGKTLGIVAGKGQFPTLVARGAKEAGFSVAMVGFTGHTDPATLAEADDEEKIRQAARRAYFSALLIAGYSPDQAQLMADAFLSGWQFNLVGSLGL